MKINIDSSRKYLIQVKLEILKNFIDMTSTKALFLLDSDLEDYEREQLTFHLKELIEFSEQEVKSLIRLTSNELSD